MAQDIDYRVINTDNKWKILTTHWRYAWWAIWVSFGTIMQGFDNVCNSIIIGMVPFQKQFGIPSPSTPGTYIIPSRYLGAWQGAMQAGSLLGAFFAGYMMDSILGRKNTIMIACAISCIGVGIQYSAHEWTVYLGGKLVNGLAIGIWFTAAPTWIGENARPECRGLFLCLYNSTIVFGQALVAFVGQGAVKIPTRWSYELCILLQFMFPAAGFAGWYWFAESPHYLIKKGRNDDAKKALRKIYSSKYPEFVEIEMGRLQEEVEFSAALKEAARMGGTPLWQCWKGGNAIRTFTAIFISAGQQLMGATFVLGYLTYFLELIGIANSFKFSAGLFVVMLVSTTTAFPLIEVFGRRNILIIPCFILVFILLIIGIMGCISNHTAGNDVIVAMIFLWGAIYQFSLGATGFAVASEISTLPLRTYTQAYIVAIDAFFGWLIGFIVPYLINPHPDGADLGGKVGFVFCGSGLLVAIGLFFLVPDSRGLSFDEMDYLYANKIAPRKFQRVNKERVLQAEALEVTVNGKTLIGQVEHAEKSLAAQVEHAQVEHAERPETVSKV